MKNLIVKGNGVLEVVELATPYEYNPLYVDRKIPLEHSFNSFVKRSFDLTASTILIFLLFSWVFPIIALLIKMETKGPVFFFQKRNKKNGRLFTCIKFRTMVVNELADSLPAMDHDFRITKLGSFLRKHHLDELPQLFNVLIGDMSMVGPRPYMISDNEKYGKLIKDYLVRHKIKPGITGLAQVVDYINPITKIEFMEQRVNKDLYYVYNWSLLLDVKIFFKTFLKVIGINYKG